MVNRLKTIFSTRASSVIRNTTINMHPAEVVVKVPWGSDFKMEDCIVFGVFKVYTQNKDGTWNPPVSYGI